MKDKKMGRNGEIIDKRYRIIEEIGRGGSARVFSAVHLRTGKKLAIKEFCRRESNRFGGGSKEIEKESEVLKSLSHPLLPDLLDVLPEEGDRPGLLIMEYVSGRNLEDYVRERGRLSDKRLLELAKQLCSLFSYLHRQEPALLYCDLKPSNIILREDGRICLVDFGAVQRELLGEKEPCYGTWQFASPEQKNGDRLDRRTDIYCLGKTLLYLWDASARPQGGRRRGLEGVLSTCCEEDPEDRFSRIEDLEEALLRAELYEELRRRHILRRMAMFSLTLFLSVAFGLLSLSLRSIAERDRRDRYQLFMERAMEAEGEDRLSLNREAILLWPDRTATYLELLDRVFLEDERFDREEERWMQETLQMQTGEGRPLYALLEQRPGYDHLAYRLGLAYFYSYEGGGNKQKAYKWLKIAEEGRQLSDRKRKLSAYLSLIAGYYAKLGRQIGEGDSNVDYKTYWRDLGNILSKGLLEEEGPRTRLLFYRELLTQIHLNAGRFRMDGVDRSSLEEGIQSVEEGLRGEEWQGLFSADQALEESWQRVEQSLLSAKKTIEAVYPR